LVHIFMCVCIIQFLLTIYIYIYTHTSLWSVCAGCMCADILSLTHPHRNTSPRGSVAQRVDEDIQGAEPPYHSKRLVGLNIHYCVQIFGTFLAFMLYAFACNKTVLSVHCSDIFFAEKYGLFLEEF